MKKTFLIWEKWMKMMNDEEVKPLYISLHIHDIGSSLPAIHITLPIAIKLV